MARLIILVMKSRSSNWQTSEEISKKLWLGSLGNTALTAYQISCCAQFNKPKKKTAHLLADLLPYDDKRNRDARAEEILSWILAVFTAACKATKRKSNAT